MNKSIFKGLAFAALISIMTINVYAQHSPACDAGPYEISGVIKDPSESDGYACSAVIVNGCYAFSCPPDNSPKGTYRLRYAAYGLEPGKEILVQIFTAGSLPIRTELPKGTAKFDATTTPVGDATTTPVGVVIRQTINGIDQCLDVQGNSTVSGTPVIFWPCHGQANQRWMFTSYGVIKSMMPGTPCLGSTEGPAGVSTLKIAACPTLIDQWDAQIRNAQGCVSSADGQGKPVKINDCSLTSLFQRWFIEE